MELNCLMHELENFISKSKTNDSDVESNCDSDSGIGTLNHYDDWELITFSKKGKDKTNNFVIEMLCNLKLEKEIFDLALQIFTETLLKCGLKRVKFKTAVMCACVWIAFSIKKDYREEKSLIEYFGINKQKYTKGLKLVKTVIIETREFKNSVNNDLFRICRDLNIIDDIKKIEEFLNNFNYDEIKQKCVFKTSPKTICFSLVYIWLLINKNNVIPLREYCEISKISNFNVIKKLIFYHKNLLKNWVYNIIDNYTKFFCDKYVIKFPIEYKELIFLNVFK